jgi:hypothetical protein
MMAKVSVPDKSLEPTAVSAAVEDSRMRGKAAGIETKVASQQLGSDSSCVPLLVIASRFMHSKDYQHDPAQFLEVNSLWHRPFRCLVCVVTRLFS